MAFNCSSLILCIITQCRILHVADSDMTHLPQNNQGKISSASPLSLPPPLFFQNFSDSMADPNSNYTRFFIKDINGYLLYHLPQTRVDWFTWECDMCDRNSEHETMLFQDGETYWSLIWYSGSLDIDAMVKFFVERSIDEKELEDKYKIIVRRSFSSEPDTGPWISTRPDAGKL